MRYKPLGDNVVLLLDKKERLFNGIIQPAGSCTYGKGLVVAKVLAAGPGTKDWGVDVRGGETVIIRDTAGELVVVGLDIAPGSAPGYEAGTEFRVVRNEEILAVVTDPAAPIPGFRGVDEWL